MRYLAFLLLASIVPLRVPSREPVTVEMREFAFQPSVIRMSAGRSVTLRFVNRGQIAHQFTTGILRSRPVVVTDARMYVEATGLGVLRVQPGESATLTFVPRERGQFSFACTIEGHREQGMEGVLQVR